MQRSGIEIPVEGDTGGQTTWNRTQHRLREAHWVDAACVGASTPRVLRLAGLVPLLITTMGMHSRPMRRTNAVGFPDKVPKAVSAVAGKRTGNVVRAVVPQLSTKAGVFIGHVAVRATAFCKVKSDAGIVQGIHMRFCRPLHRGDGYTYNYQKGRAALPPPA